MTKLYPFQEEGVDALDRFGGRALLADEMGLGKTVTALHWLRDNRSARPAVVVCPASIKWQWQREASVHVGMRAQVLDTTKVPKRPRLTDSPLVVVNYDILHAWLPYLLRLQPKVLIADEVHYCANIQTRRTKVARRLAKEAEHVIAITGTPLTSRPVQLWPILNMVRPDLYPAFRPFADKHCAPKFNGFGWDFSGAENLDELHQQLVEHLMIRHRKQDVLDQLPPVSRNLILLDLKDRKEYSRAMSDFKGWLRSQHRAGLWDRVTGLAKLSEVKQLVARLKMPFVLQWVADFLEAQDKLILFGWHRKVVDEVLHKFGRAAVKIDGSVTGKDRQATVDKFNNDARCRLLVGNLQAAGVGWSAKGCADTSFCEFGWTPALHTQAEARAHGLFRGKQGQVTSAWYLVAKGTIEEGIVELIQKRQKTLDATLDGKPTNDGFDLYTRLVNRLTNGPA